MGRVSSLSPLKPAACWDTGFAKTLLTILGRVFGPQLALWFPGVAPSPPPPCVLWGEGDARGLWAGTVVGGTPGLSLPWPGSCLWSRGQALKFSPRATLIKSGSRAWEAHGTLPREVGGQGALSLPGSHPHPSSLLACPQAPPGLTTDPPRDTVHSQEPRRPRVAPGPLRGSHRTRGTRPGGAQSTSEQPTPGPSWPR